MRKIFLGMLIGMLSFMSANAQIGYQVSLLNSATGEPRANETVSANIVITDAYNNIVHSESQSVTTNDFGVLSLFVGNDNTFKDVAIGRLPLYISVTVGGTLIGKSQILNVPVAEIANTLKSNFTLQELCGKTWIVSESWGEDWHSEETVTFYTNGTWTRVETEAGVYAGQNLTRTTIRNGTYEIEGNNIYAYRFNDTRNEQVMDIYRFKNSMLYIRY